MSHLTLIVFIFSLAAGLLGVILFGELHRLHGRRYLRLGLIQLVCFNLILLIQLLYSYYSLNLATGPPALGLLVAYLALSTPLKPAWVIVLGAMLAELLGRLRSSRLTLWLVPSGIALIALSIGLAIRALATGDPTSMLRLQQTVEIPVLLGMPLIGGIVLRLARRSIITPEITIARNYARLILGSWLLIAASVLLGEKLWPGSVEFRLFFHALLIGAFNLGSYLLFRRGLRALPAFSPGDEPDWERMARDYGITPREREILELICAGKRNQEIADTLFVTLQTVKDHNVRIFRKLGVRSRVQAANLVRGNPSNRIAVGDLPAGGLH